MKLLRGAKNRKETVTALGLKPTKEILRQPLRKRTTPRWTGAAAFGRWCAL